MGEDGGKLKRAHAYTRVKAVVSLRARTAGSGEDDNKVTRARTPVRWEDDGKLHVGVNDGKITRARTCTWGKTVASLSARTPTRG